MSRIIEAKPNRASAEEAASFVDKVEELEARIETFKAEHMNRCKKVREEIKEVLSDAKSQGVAKGLVKAIVKARTLEAKAKAAREALEEDDQDFFDDIRKALGDFADTPLGTAAVDAGEDKTSEIVDFVSKQWAGEDQNEADDDDAA